MDFNSLLNVASDAAQTAGRHALDAISTAKPSIKNGNELVTQLDTQCQNIIIDRIQKSFPGQGFVAEEGPGGKLLKIKPASEPFWWVIDPIDGTNNYAHGVFCFSVSIAVISNGMPVVGVVFDPNTNALFTAVSGSPSLCNGKVMQTTSETINEYASVAVDSHFEEKFAPAICGLIQKSRFRNFGTTALHLAYVAKAGLVGMVLQMQSFGT
jgi:myo-inositol-1(or 4)-monophosphatase